MKYFPYVVFYEQQKKSETVKVSNIFVSCKLQKCITSRQCVFWHFLEWSWGTVAGTAKSLCQQGRGSYSWSKRISKTSFRDWTHWSVLSAVLQIHASGPSLEQERNGRPRVRVPTYWRSCQLVLVYCRRYNSESFHFSDDHCAEYSRAVWRENELSIQRDYTGEIYPYTVTDLTFSCDLFVSFRNMPQERMIL